MARTGVAERRGGGRPAAAGLPGAARRAVREPPPLLTMTPLFVGLCLDHAGRRALPLLLHRPFSARTAAARGSGDAAPAIQALTTASAAAPDVGMPCAKRSRERSCAASSSLGGRAAAALPLAPLAGLGDAVCGLWGAERVVLRPHGRARA